MIVLLHSSKSMRQRPAPAGMLTQPVLLGKSIELASYLKTLRPSQLVTAMNISANLSQKTYELIQDWNSDKGRQTDAIDSFTGDIYSGLQASSMSKRVRSYSNGHLFILSGLYGLLRPNDAIFPYRLEMGYRFPDKEYGNLYDFWGDDIAKLIPRDETILNLAAVEYSKVISRYVDATRFISPKFLTLNKESGEAIFVTVHAKIARGAFARWAMEKEVKNETELNKFTDLGYKFMPALSEPGKPTFVTKEFGGLGLSVRLT